MQVPKDKQLHIIAGFIITLCTIWFGVWVALSCLIIAGVGKEVIWDWLLGKGTPDPWDTLATIVGGFPVLSLGMFFI